MDRSTPPQQINAESSVDIPPLCPTTGRAVFQIDDPYEHPLRHENAEFHTDLRSGIERRQGPEDRRQSIRFNDRSDRRSGHDRRKDLDTWDREHSV